VFRLQWLGGALERTEAFHAAVEQLPINPNERVNGIRFLVTFLVNVYVSPERSAPALRVVSVEPAATAAGGPGARLTLENLGTRYAYLSQSGAVLRVRRPSGETERSFALDDDEIRRGYGDVLVLPGARKQVVLALPVPVAGKTLSVEIAGPPS